MPSKTTRCTERQSAKVLALNDFENGSSGQQRASRVGYFTSIRCRRNKRRISTDGLTEWLQKHHPYDNTSPWPILSLAMRESKKEDIRTSRDVRGSQSCTVSLARRRRPVQRVPVLAPAEYLYRRGGGHAVRSLTAPSSPRANEQPKRGSRVLSVYLSAFPRCPSEHVSPVHHRVTTASPPRHASSRRIHRPERAAPEPTAPANRPPRHTAPLKPTMMAKTEM